MRGVSARKGSYLVALLEGAVGGARCGMIRQGMRLSISSIVLVTLSLGFACAGGDSETSTGMSATLTSISGGLTSGASAPTSGSSGSSTTTMSGASGASETSGDPTTTSVSTGSSTGDSSTGAGASGFCSEACVDDEDCLIEGEDAGYVCQSGDCIPNDSHVLTLCLDDEICELVVPVAGRLCASNNGCFAPDVCVLVDGYLQPGACAKVPDDMGVCFQFAQTIESKPLVDGGEAEVCLLPLRCKPELSLPGWYGCELPLFCQVDDDCVDELGVPVCTGGRCVCTEDAHCAEQENATHCVGGQCSCIDDSDCAGTPGAETCVDGVCGCASARMCPSQKFDGTESRCE